jgi:putative FmdB family regulatory protein
VPTYQYACTECGHSFEQVQSFSDDALTVCPQCEGKLRKVYNAVGVVFKGSGFYRNDSRATTTSSDAPASGEKKSDAKSESKGDGAKSDSSSKKSDSGGSTSSSSSSTSTPAAS